MRLYRIEDTRGLITDWWADDIEHAIEQWRDDENDAAVLVTKIARLLPAPDPPDRDQGGTVIIHTDARWKIVYDATKVARMTGRIVMRGSRTHAHAYHVTLWGDLYVSRRRTADGLHAAATWDQWGVFLSWVFHADRYARCGSKTNPAYADASDFHAKTNARFLDGRFPSDYHGDHRWVFPQGQQIGACRDCSALDLRFAGTGGNR